MGICCSDNKVETEIVKEISTIIITGPPDSGKTVLSRNLYKYFKKRINLLGTGSTEVYSRIKSSSTAYTVGSAHKNHFVEINAELPQPHSMPLSTSAQSSSSNEASAKDQQTEIVDNMNIYISRILQFLWLSSLYMLQYESQNSVRTPRDVQNSVDCQYYLRNSVDHQYYLRKDSFSCKQAQLSSKQIELILQYGITIARSIFSPRLLEM
jgi:hypothetical protein